MRRNVIIRLVITVIMMLVVMVVITRLAVTGFCVSPRKLDENPANTFIPNFLKCKFRGTGTDKITSRASLAFPYKKLRLQY